mgnify:CR=1 FL=1
MLEVFIIIGLLCYIGFLHYQLVRRKAQIESLNDGEKSETYDEQEGDLSQNFDIPSSQSGFEQFGEYSFLTDKMLEWIFERDNTKIFLHYTREKSDADSILENGFKFVTSFYKTAEEVRHDITDLTYKHNRLKAFGDYLIVIAIDIDLYHYFMKATYKFPSYDVFVEQILSLDHPFLNEDSDMVYTLDHRFIKGYIDLKRGEVIHNSCFDPAYSSEVFEENLRKLTI